ncbi:primase-helicase zinc-binding domain-containing protein [Gymnodinialimonas hymeniacidonis]|uniref:primase-helicase zinc-binding domain-containing protein n=1 Tax=Gymnodinialimonas hymeniacidonis TaxID=3126508 RepID=UPI0034C6C793
MTYQSKQVVDEFTGLWRRILVNAGIPSEFLSARHGPCPLCGGKDRFRFDDVGGNGTWFCNQCGNGNGYELLKRRLGIRGFPEAKDEARRLLGATTGPVNAFFSSGKKNNPADFDQQKRLWEQAHQITPSSEAGLYLTSRELDLPYDAEYLRVSASPISYDGSQRFVAMLAKLVDQDGNFVGLHKTHLLGGMKAPVPKPKTFGRGSKLDGGFVGDGLHNSEIFGIAEGIENAMAASVLFGCPVAAAVTADNLSKFKPPVGVRVVNIYADNDPSGEAKAERLRRRLEDAHFEVHVEYPCDGKDWCDELLSLPGTGLRDTGQLQFRSRVVK